MILAGDVGGTKVHLALYDFDEGRLEHVRDEKYQAREYSGLEDIVRKFLAKGTNSGEEITAACFGVPGPVRDGRLKLTNLPWTLDSRTLAQNLKIEQLFLINDLEANGYGVPELSPEQIYVLSEGDTSQVGNRGLISAGTGLGQAILVWNGKVHVPMPSEGGHCDFAARDDEEIELFRYLRARYKGRVSFERVVSGMGITNIYEFLRDAKGMQEPTWLRDRMKVEDPNAVIGELGVAGSNELCSRALDMFVSAYGAEAGNLALKALSVGGVYLGGGVAPRILPKMESGLFMKAFLDKGRLSGLLKQMPVRIILESRAALMGAAAYAEARAAEISGRSARAASIHAS
ncbi:MAG TPA: glucokinase [Acidisarcina sp.]|nr:glucokinase [Acidisarcina sp.]